MTALCALLAVAAALAAGLALWTGRAVPALARENALLRHGLLYLRPVNRDTCEALSMRAAGAAARSLPFALTDAQLGAVQSAVDEAIGRYVADYQEWEMVAIARDRRAGGVPPHQEPAGAREIARRAPAGGPDDPHHPEG